jgi:hypothetical protein
VEARTLPSQLSVRAVLLAVYFVSLPFLDLGFSLPGLPWKKLVLSDLAFVMLVAWVARAARERLLPCRRWLLILAALPVAAAAVSSVANDGVGAGLAPVLRTAYSMIVLTFIAHLSLAREDQLFVAKAWTAAAVGVSVFALASLFAYLGGVPQGPLIDISTNLGAVPRAKGVMPTNALVLYLQTSLLFCAFVGMQRTNCRQDRAAWAAFAGILATGAFTLSRGLVGMFVSLSMLSAGFREQPLWRFRRWIAGAAVLIAIGALTLTILPGSSPLDGLPPDPAVRNAYFVLHRAAVRMWLGNPWVGVGPEAFGRHIAGFTSVAERIGARPPLRPGVEYAPHSFWFGSLAEGGVLSAISWLALLGWISHQLCRGRRSAPLSALMLINVLGVVINGFHVDLGYLKFIWVAIGVGLAAGEARPSLAVSEGGQTSERSLSEAGGAPPL